MVFCDADVFFLSRQFIQQATTHLIPWTPRIGIIKEWDRSPPCWAEKPWEQLFEKEESSLIVNDVQVMESRDAWENKNKCNYLTIKTDNNKGNGTKKSRCPKSLVWENEIQMERLESPTWRMITEQLLASLKRFGFVLFLLNSPCKYRNH